MNDEAPQPTPVVKSSDSSHLVYLLFLFGSITFGVTAIFGLIWAYFERGRADEMLTTHYTFLIHTFWKGLLIFLLGAFTLFFFVGFLIWFFWFFWVVIRVLRGWSTLRNAQPIAKPRRWGF